MTDPTNTLVTSTYQLITFSNKTTFPVRFLRDALPDVATAMFFAKVYELTPADVSSLLREVMPTSDTVKALLAEAELHSDTLQDYLIEEFLDDDGTWTYQTQVVEGETDAPAPVQAEILPEVWKALEIEIADSIAKVAEKIKDTIGHLPGRSGEMVFQTLAKVNARRPVVGDYRATIKHQQVARVLVVFDVSGSMSESTVRTIVDDVVGLAYEANASLAVVSNTCTFWDAGAFSTQVVLDAAEYGGTHYEELAPLFADRDWDVVITVADYDSAYGAKTVLGQCSGRIGELFDISLVDRSTFLAECLGQLAGTVRPLLISSRNLCY